MAKFNQVMIFHSKEGFQHLENIINMWLNMDQTRIIVDIKYQDNRHYCSALVHYQLDGGPTKSEQDTPTGRGSGSPGIGGGGKSLHEYGMGGGGGNTPNA